MNRRAAIGLVGSSLILPILARGQDRSWPLIGFLGGRSAQTDAHLLAAFLQGLADAGYADGRNARIEYRWADGRYDRLPGLAAELVRLKPEVIVAVGGSASAMAAKAATTTIPVVFSVGGDPVELGIVASLSRPGGNMTGMTMFSADLDAKRLELLRDIAPSARILAVVVNPGNPSTDSELRQARTAAGAFGQTLHVFNARSEAEIDAAFHAIGQLRADTLAVASDAFLIGRRARIVALARDLRLPTVYAVREFAEAGGLMSYGTNFADMYRQVGVYAGRVLKGAAPASLPVQRPTRYELVVNLKTAKALGITIPPSILLRADKVIE
jgi:putative tryptophan/tyrosine transport system substrate-binding protein